MGGSLEAVGGVCWVEAIGLAHSFPLRFALIPFARPEFNLCGTSLQARRGTLPAQW